MVIDSALTIASEYYKEHGNLSISKVYETESSWIIFASKNGMTRFGSNGISIDKSTGNISSFRLPSRENFAILEAAKKIEL